MSNLADIQRSFLNTVLNDADPSFDATIKGDGLSTPERISIYRNNVMSSLSAALAAIYPATERLVGQDYFRQCAFAYIQSHPSRSGNLHNFGHCFPDFISSLTPMARLPYTRDVARIEWARHHAYHAADESELLLNELSQITSEHHSDLCFKLAHSVTLISSIYPVVSIWSANQTDTECEDIIDLNSGPQTALVWRHNGEVLVRQLSVGEHALLDAFARGQLFGQAIDAAVHAEPELNIAECLHAQLCTGVVTDFNH